MQNEKSGASNSNPNPTPLVLQAAASLGQIMGQCSEDLDKYLEEEPLHSNDEVVQYVKNTMQGLLTSLKGDSWNRHTINLFEGWVDAINTLCEYEFPDAKEKIMAWLHSEVLNLDYRAVNTVNRDFKTLSIDIVFELPVIQEESGYEWDLK
jgi:hypothetical protein